MLKKRKKKNPVVSIIMATVISIAIGLIFQWSSTQTLRLPFSKYLWNTGYSVFLGLSLFANGFLFHGIERRYISWVRHPLKSIIIALAFHLSYSTVAIFISNWLWFVLLRHQTWAEFIKYGWFIIVGEYIILIIITSIIYANSFFKEWKEGVIQSEKLKQEAILLQYQVMQNQVNPHFLFNSLNVLGSLIDVDKEKAKEFTRELSMFYRELLYFKDKELVPLSEEINFLQKYIYLQKIRFGSNFNVEIVLPDDLKHEVIPMSIQMMVENAVKHNIISKEKPLKIVIGKNSEDEIYIENNLQPRENVSGSNHIGLKNLTERYKFLTGKEMFITRDDHTFKVIMPLINL